MSGYLKNTGPMIKTWIYHNLDWGDNGRRLAIPLIIAEKIGIIRIDMVRSKYA